MNWFSANLRYLRRSAGMRQSDLAEHLGYKSFTTVQKWESGVAKPGIDTVEKLARLFQVRIDELLSRDLSQPEPDASTAASGTPESASGDGKTDLFAAAESIEGYQPLPAAKTAGGNPKTGTEIAEAEG